MGNHEEPECWNDHEVQLEDLSVPDKGFRLFLYVLGENLNGASRFRVRPIALLCTIGLLCILFLPSSALLNPTVLTPHSTFTTSQQNIACQEITVNSKDINLHIPPSIPTPPDSVTLHMCSTNNVHFITIPVSASPGPSNSK